MNENKKRGRPKGSHITQVETVAPSRCKCGSTRRSAYFGKTEYAFPGLDDYGQPYTHVIRRRTKCLDCGQTRIVRSEENRKSAAE